MPRTRTTKKLAQRIDLEYFKRSSPLRHWRFLLSVALPALAIVWLAWYAVRSDRRVYSAGSLSSAHAVLSKQCAACHLTQVGFFSEKTSDQKCLACHDGAIHHAAQEFTPSCASCHADHRGAIRLAATSDANCTQCHSSLATRTGSTAFARNVKGFEGDHPDFAVLRAGHGDPGTIQLNHYRPLAGQSAGTERNPRADGLRGLSSLEGRRESGVALWGFAKNQARNAEARSASRCRCCAFAGLYGACDVCAHMRRVPFAAIRQAIA